MDKVHIVRHKVLVEGRSQRAVARELGLARVTVRKYIDQAMLGKVVRALRAPDRALHFVYEAGPCGFGIYRHLTSRGEHCVVVSPSMVPKRSGDRVKTDRRDSVTLVRLHRAGELRAIYVPNDADEAMRDLVRAREDAVVVGTQAKDRLKAFLLRQGRRYPGREGWTLPYRRWLTDLSFPTARNTSRCRNTATRSTKRSAGSNG